MTAVYRALLAEGDRYLEEAQSKLAQAGGRIEGAHFATAHAALAQALYTRAALEKPDIGAAILAAAKAHSNTVPPASELPTNDPIVQSMDRHPAGKKRVARKAAPRSVK